VLATAGLVFRVPHTTTGTSVLTASAEIVPGGVIRHMQGNSTVIALGIIEPGGVAKLNHTSVVNAKGTWFRDYTTSGQLTTGGAAVADITITVGKSFTWRVASEQEFSKTFTWRVNDGILRYYRIEGRCLTFANCFNASINVNDPQCESQTFVQIIPAASVADLCSKAAKTGGLTYPMVWPWKSVKRYSLPVDAGDLAELAARGEDTVCNELVVEDFCEIPECLQFCLDYIANVGIGASVSIQEKHYKYMPSGGIRVSGDTPAEKLNPSHIGSGGIAVGGAAIAASSFHSYTPSMSSPHLVIAGAVDPVKSSKWHYIGCCGGHPNGPNGGLLIGGAAAVVSSYWRYKATGGISVGGSSEVSDFVLRYSATGGLRSSGSAPSFWIDPAYEASGGMTLGGSATAIADYYAYEGTGGLMVGGEAGVVSNIWRYTATGGMVLGGMSNSVLIYVPAGGLLASGSAGTYVTLRYTAMGSVVTGGTGGPFISPWFSYPGVGGLTIGGQADAEDNFYDMMGVDIAGDAELDLLEFVPETNIDLPEGTTAFSIDDEVVLTDCGCKELGLRLFMRHNFGDGNLLKEFLFRNGMALPQELSLLYRESESSWSKSYHFKGMGHENQLEQWDLFFDWGCTSIVGGHDLDVPSWKFGFFARRKNLVTKEDTTTRMLFTFPKDAPCQEADNFGFQFRLNTQTKDITTGNVYIETFIFFDEIGLFDGKQWLKDPILEVRINEISSSQIFNRLNLTPTIPERSLLLIS